MDFVFCWGEKQMKKVIIYGSLYGAAKNYAETLSRFTGVKAYNYKKVKDLSKYKQIVYIGGLYLGGVIGLRQTIRFAPEEAEFILITVGIDDIFNKKCVDKINRSLQNQVPPYIYNKAKIFHLKGRIDYGRLKFRHRLIMAFLYQSLKEKSRVNWAEENNMFIQTYCEKVDFVEYTSLIPIAEEMM